MCIPGLHLSLGIYNRLWLLLEESCKELDFILATSSSGSVSGVSCCDHDDLHKLSNLKLELDTDRKYSEHISELLTYYTLTSDDLSSNVYASLKTELEATNKRIKNKVTIFFLKKKL